MPKKKYSIYWGDTHHNTYTFVQDQGFDFIVNFASKILDFYTAAYYTPAHEWVQSRNPENGELYPHSKYSLALEVEKPAKQIKTEWNEVESVTSKYNKDGQFTVFPGYEWQGSGSWGDLNVVFRNEGALPHVPKTIEELYEILKHSNIDAIAIPHHTAYHTGIRAPYWDLCNEEISPFAEIYSVHGSSELDEEHPGMRVNSHMGPGTGGSTYSDALKRGLHLGAICSTDNWTNMPGRWNHGLMGVLSKELTRESIWQAFKARRVYGVTGDRIKLSFEVNGHDMGSINKFEEKRKIEIGLECSDSIDRVEILKNEKVLHTYCHQGQWNMPQTGQLFRFKLRLEMGWGPRVTDMPEPKHSWHGTLRLSRGKILNWEPSWIHNEQEVPLINNGEASFVMTSKQEYTTETYQGGLLFEFETYPEASLELDINNQKVKYTVEGLLQQSHILWYKQETLDMIKKHTGLSAHELPREDPLIYHYSYKVKIHKAIPQAGYQTSVVFHDSEKPGEDTWYRIRVEQRNGQKAWSSPIWFKG